MLPEVIQVISTDDYKVYVYMDDNTVRLYDAAPLIAKGGIFSRIQDIEIFKSTCTILNDTLAWDLSGCMDGINCIDICIKGKRIAIRKNIPTLAKKADVLAEEMGHYHTGVGRIINSNNTHSRKQEHSARLWSYNKRIGLIGIIQAYHHGCRNRFEVADFLNVSEDTLTEALEYYRQIYGTYVAIDNYVIMFEPYLAVYEKME